VHEAPQTREGIIQAAKRAAEELRSSVLSRRDFTRSTGISDYHIYRLFPDGGWTEVRTLAGLDKHPHDREALTDEQLLAEFHRVVSMIGEIPPWHVFTARADISSDVIRRRFGGLQGTLARYQGWLDEHEPNSPLVAVLRVRSKHEVPTPPTPDLPRSATSSTEWSKTDTTEYGAPINFRGLRHAPINEQGVVYLFGMVSYELGFLVEAIHTAYPDCEAKRCVDRHRDRWQRVSVEFEYRSSNFHDQGHDPRKCDVIVCWEHNWSGCPIEVVELRRVINDLQG
jgi:hypothetical protein